MSDEETKEEAKISIKVVVDRVKKRVIYAEADHTFVDILFCFMTMPLGTIVRLLEDLEEDLEEEDSKFEAFGSLNNLYQSLKDFPRCYWTSSRLLNHTSLLYDRCTMLKLVLDKELMKTCFCCFRSRPDFGLCSLPDNGDPLHGFDEDEGVFVSTHATFIVTDDLCVMPYTSTTTIRLLTDHGITDMSCLEDVKLELDSEKMLFLLKMALSLHSPLTCLVFPSTNLLRYVYVSEYSSTITGQPHLSKTEEVSSSKILVDVYVEKSTSKLLFAEAKKDFFDFLFGFFSIPLGTVVGNLLKEESSLICMENIFKSILDMSVEDYLWSQDIKDKLLKPHIGQMFVSKNQLFPLKGLPFLYCDKKPTDPRSNGGLLKPCGRFMVTDDLIITPSSSFLTMNTLNKLNVRFDDIQIHELTIGLEEALRLLKASLLSRSTLTDSLIHQLKN